MQVIKENKYANFKKENEEKEEGFSKKLMETRSIVISGSVDGKLADKVVKQLLQPTH